MKDPQKKKKNSMVELPLDLIHEILPRLPPKYVGRCRCVCKQWNSYLSTPEFGRIHLCKQKQLSTIYYKLLIFDSLVDNSRPPGSFCKLDCETLRVRDMVCIPSKHFDPKVKYILTSLDGLVCLTSMDKKRFAFWNPLTGAYKMLPYNDIQFPNMRYRNGIIGFYIDSSNDYKLLHIALAGNCRDTVRACRSYIYSQRLDSWRKINININFHYKNPNTFSYWSKATFSGQTLYFNLRSSINSDLTIISFDVDSEVFRVIQFPPIPRGISTYSGGLVVLNGSIHLCVAYRGGGGGGDDDDDDDDDDADSYELVAGDLWRLDGDGDGWVKVTAFPHSYYHIQDLRSRSISTIHNMCGNWFAIAEDNKNDKSFHKVSMEDFATNYWYFKYPKMESTYYRTIYVETLISPHPSE